MPREQKAWHWFCCWQERVYATTIVWTNNRRALEHEGLFDHVAVGIQLLRCGHCGRVVTFGLLTALQETALAGKLFFLPLSQKSIGPSY